MSDQFFQKCYFCSKTKKMNTEFHMLELLGFSSEKQSLKKLNITTIQLSIELVSVRNINLNRPFLIFEPNLLKSGISILEQKK